MSMAPLSLDEVHRAVDAANRRFAETFSAGDIAGAVRGVYTRDARLMPPGAPTIRGLDDIVGFWEAAVPQLGVSGVALTTVELHPLGDTAYEIGRATLRLAGGQEVDSKYVVIWKQEDGQWRWHVDIFNMDAG